MEDSDDASRKIEDFILGPVNNNTFKFVPGNNKDEQLIYLMARLGTAIHMNNQGAIIKVFDTVIQLKMELDLSPLMAARNLFQSSQLKDDTFDKTARELAAKRIIDSNESVLASVMDEASKRCMFDLMAYLYTNHSAAFKPKLIYQWYEAYKDGVNSQLDVEFLQSTNELKECHLNAYVKMIKKRNKDLVDTYIKGNKEVKEQLKQKLVMHCAEGTGMKTVQALLGFFLDEKDPEIDKSVFHWCCMASNSVNDGVFLEELLHLKKVRGVNNKVYPLDWVKMMDETMLTRYKGNEAALRVLAKHADPKKKHSVGTQLMAENKSVTISEYEKKQNEVAISILMA